MAVAHDARLSNNERLATRINEQKKEGNALQIKKAVIFIPSYCVLYAMLQFPPSGRYYILVIASSSFNFCRHW